MYVYTVYVPKWLLGFGILLSSTFPLGSTIKHVAAIETTPAYNLSPSFNWRAYGYSGLCRSSPKIDHADLERFISNAVGLGLLSPISSPNGGPSQSDGMLADVETVQCKEKEIGCDVLSHQKKKVSFHLLHHSSNYIPSFLLRRSGAFSALSSASEVIEHLFA